jgi:hypothetical protein
MFNKTRAAKRFIRRNKAKFFMTTTVVATLAALRIKSQKKEVEDDVLKFVTDYGFQDEYFEYRFPQAK